MTQIVSERDVIERVKLNDPEAFKELYERHRRRVYSLCLRMARDGGEAEDLAQEVFLQVFRKIATFRGDSAFSTWLHRLTVNLVLMSRRKKIHTQSCEPDPRFSEEKAGWSADIATEDVSLSGAVDRVQLERAIDSLPPGCRSILILHDVKGYQHRDIAGMLDCSVGNSKSQLHKARMKLRTLIMPGPAIASEHRKEQPTCIPMPKAPVFTDETDVFWQAA